jgi:hypothetical protein
LVKAGPTIFSCRYERDDAAATLAVPVGFFGALGELEELPQPAAASPMQVNTSSPAMPTPLRFLGIATIIRP